MPPPGFVVPYDTSIFDQIYTNPKIVSCYSSVHSILLIGEGDFSFALALAVKLGGRKIVATSYDSRVAVLEKYPHAITALNALRTAHVEVHHGVDVATLAQQSWMRQFNRVIFNFPHIGGSSDEDVVLNQELLANYFKSVAPSLSRDPQGQAIVALRNTSFYDKWKIEDQAKKAGLKLKQTRPFPARDFPLYKPVRTQPMVREAPACDNALNYIFVEAEEGELDYDDDEEEVEEEEGGEEQEEIDLGEEYKTANKKEIRKRKKELEKAKKEKEKENQSDQHDQHVQAWREQHKQEAAEESEDEDGMESTGSKRKRFRVDPTGQQKVRVKIPGWDLRVKKPKQKKPKKKKTAKQIEREKWEQKKKNQPRAERKRKKRAQEEEATAKKNKPKHTGSVAGPDGVEYLIWDE
jgi:25S rRNA (uracil2634-N3)-methyltransferase